MFGLTTLGISACSLSATFGAAYYATCAVRSQWLGETFWHGREDTSSVALTFDDGPADDTGAILDLLAEQNLKATFFMVGRQVERYPEAARRVVGEGHEVGNHSYSHPVYLYRSARETRSQLRRAQATIAGTTGVEPKLARPPCGVRTPAYFSAAREMNLRTVQWSDAGFDWQKIGAREIARNVLRKVRSGSIILLHDADSRLRRDRRQTLLSLPFIIEGLKGRGLRVAPLSELLSTV